MVKGHSNSCSEANPILDELVRETFQFISNNPSHIAERQVGRFFEKEHDIELTDRLRNANLISDGYVAVLSGTNVGDSFENGNYQLVIYTVNGLNPWEKRGSVNANLNISLRKGTKQGIKNAVGEYMVDNPYAIVFEENNSIVEGWSQSYRPIEITKSVVHKISKPAKSETKIFASTQKRNVLESSGQNLISIGGIQKLSERLEKRPQGWRKEVHTLYQRLFDNNEIESLQPLIRSECATFFLRIGTIWRASRIFSHIKHNMTEEELVIDAVGEHHSGKYAGHSVLSLGKKIISKDSYQPVYWCVAPSQGFKIGQKLDRSDLDKFPPAEKVFYKRNLSLI